MIEFIDYSFTYEGEESPSLHHINLRIEQGECILITGLSGCGKSTLLRVINCLCPSVFPGTAEGSFQLEGHGWTESSAAHNAAYVGSVLQDAKAGFLFREPEDECRFPAQCLHRSRGEIEEEFAIYEAAYPDLFANDDVLNLSSGQSQILSILSQKLKHSKVIIMDEPTANLDLAEIDELQKHIEALKEAGNTIIIAEHRTYYIAPLSDRMLFMKEGRLVNGQAYPLRHMDLDQFKPPRPYHHKPKATLEIINMGYRKGEKTILSKSFGSFVQGEVVAVIGPNGSGKSVFGKCLCGLLRSKGKLIALNREVLTDRELVSQTYYGMQEAYKQMVCATVREEILLQDNTLGEEDINELLAKVDLQSCKEQHPSKLSGGQVQRLGVLLAFISQVKIVVLDEPTSGLDYPHMLQVAAIMEEMKRADRFVFLISHDRELLAKVADSYLWIEGGRVHEIAPIKSVEDMSLMERRMAWKEAGQSANTRAKGISPFINPVVNIVVFLAMANAIFLYPTTQSSWYLLGLLLVIFIINTNFWLAMKAVVVYGLLTLIKSLVPIYYQVTVEIFLIRGSLTGFAMKNIVEKTRTIDMVEALYKVGAKDIIMIPLIAMLRLFPTLRYDSTLCMMSLKTRKLLQEKHPIKIWNRFIVPLVFSLIRSAENLACGMETKGMVINQKRTTLTSVAFRLHDGIILAIFAIIYILIFLGGIK